MKHGVAVALLLLASAVAGCHDADVGRSNTAVLGGTGRGDGFRAVPAPPAPRGVEWHLARTGDDTAAAVWVADDHVVASRWTGQGGWTGPEPLERIHGQSSEVVIVGNGQGQAMAVWHHRVGNIHSLRFSWLDGGTWSQPDVVPGALPRPAVAGTPAGENGVQLEMDAQGVVTARWPSGFHANEEQVARYTPGEGWNRAASEPLASAQSASPASPAPSSAR